MAANIAPIFPIMPQQAWAKLTAANTLTDGTGTVPVIFTAEATDGSRCDGIIARALGTNVATVVRVFVNNGATPATAGNNSLIAEVALPASTASNSAEIGGVYIPLNLNLAPGYKIMVCIGTAVAAGWQFTAVGGDYA